MLKHLKLLFVGTILICINLLIGCNKQEDTATTVKDSEYVYLADFETLDQPTGTYLTEFMVRNDSLYYEYMNYSSTDPLDQYRIYKKPLLTQDIADVVPVSLQVDETGNCYTVNQSDKIIILTSTYSEDSSEETYYLNQYDQTGNLEYRINLSDTIADETDFRYLCTDSNDRVYIATGNQVFLFQADGSFFGTVESSKTIESIGTAADGNVYISYHEFSGSKLAQIDFERRKLSSSNKNFETYSTGLLTSGLNGDLLMNSGSTLYDYTVSTKDATPILNWAESGIIGSSVQYSAVLSDERIAVVSSAKPGTDGLTEFILLEKRPTTNVKDKEVLVLASVYPNTYIKSKIDEFNAKNGKYWIEVKTYAEDTDEDISSAIMAINHDLLNTYDIDLIDLGSISGVDSYSRMGLFEDLNRFLNESKSLHKEDFLEAALEGGTYGDKLITLPTNFTIDAYIAKKEIFGDKKSLTIDDVLALSKEYPAATLYDFGTNKGALFSMLYYYADTFVNWETGKCNFDTDEFVKFLEFADQYPTEQPTNQKTDLERFKEDSLLLLDGYTTSVELYEYYVKSLEGEPFTYIGRPTPDGTSGYIFQMSGDKFAITSKSRHKEGAWAFIEWLHTTYQDVMFSTNKNKLDQQLEEAMQPEYDTDSDGNLIERPAEIMLGNGEIRELYTILTQEEVDVIKDLITSATIPKSDYGSDNKIINIVTEEAQAYFSKDKTAEEVVAIIQNRVQLYMDEMSE
jgi:ABC-type glycerol-3-phosphate transport system substrate-binding protein